MAHSIVLCTCLAVAVYLVHRYYVRGDTSRRLVLPPGPKSLPIVGNITDLPKKGQPEFQYWLKYKDLYGPISSTTVLGRTFIILHDLQDVQHLLQKESAKSSDRPFTEFAFNLCGLDDFMARRYDPDFRHRRKLVHQQLGTPKLVERFDDIQEAESRQFLFRVLNEPNGTIEHLKHSMGSLILKMTYGYAVEPNSADPLIELIERMADNLVKATIPWLVDFIPALKYLPDGLPGTAFKKTARRFEKVNQAVVDVPYRFVRRQMAAGDHRPSYVSQLVQECSNGEPDSSRLSDLDETAIKRTAAAMYVGGSETTVTALTSFVLAMTMFPEVQRKAQDEIDSLVGNERLPSLADRARLPYIEALVKEVFRWSPIAPLAIPHATSEDMEYRGYYIPKGAVLVPMTWWFLKNPDVHHEPDLFNPDRFLEPRNEPDPRTTIFGYGRRVCPGRYFSETNVFIIVAQLLAAFNIRKATGENGVEIQPTLEVLPGLISHVKEFPFRVEVRSAKHAELVRRVEREQPLEEGDCHLLDRDEIKESLEYKGEGARSRK
ncbi:Cytochrome P450 [Metarhizium rileyi]|uniref:Cytochrome P450 n=1 Tax=Metarhizium rileyi (strain RCEF 4871) TaxID=1649241 RepID=A0A166Y398_METRR|nr:Cytochrome P450 [Metarhizium rileyi RCEF 4871]